VKLEGYNLPADECLKSFLVIHFSSANMLRTVVRIQTIQNSHGSSC